MLRKTKTASDYSALGRVFCDRRANVRNIMAASMAVRMSGPTFCLSRWLQTWLQLSVRLRLGLLSREFPQGTAQLRMDPALCRADCTGGMWAFEWMQGSGSKESWLYLGLPSTTVLFLSMVIFLA